MDCKMCSGSIPDDAVFCRHCGARADGNLECPVCFVPNEEDSAFCAKCGTRVDGKSVCGGCGAVLAKDEHFCGKCGTAAVVPGAMKSPAKRAADKKFILGLVTKCFLLACSLVLFISSFFTSITIEYDEIPTLEVKQTSVQVIAAMFAPAEMQYAEKQMTAFENEIMIEFASVSHPTVAVMKKMCKIASKYNFVRITKGMCEGDTNALAAANATIITYGVTFMLQILLSGAVFIIFLSNLLFYIFKRREKEGLLRRLEKIGMCGFFGQIFLSLFYLFILDIAAGAGISWFPLLFAVVPIFFVYVLRLANKEVKVNLRVLIPQLSVLALAVLFAAVYVNTALYQVKSAVDSYSYVFRAYPGELLEAFGIVEGETNQISSIISSAEGNTPLLMFVDLEYFDFYKWAIVLFKISGIVNLLMGLALAAVICRTLSNITSGKQCKLPLIFAGLIVFFGLYVFGCSIIAVKTLNDTFYAAFNQDGKMYSASIAAGNIVALCFAVIMFAATFFTAGKNRLPLSDGLPAPAVFTAETAE